MRNALLILSLFIPLCALSGCARESGAASTGRAYYLGYGCNTCHKIGNDGGNLGPDLTTVGFRKSPEWLDLWLKDPQGWDHNVVMPNFFLKEPVRKALVEYLSTLKGQDFKEGTKPWDDPALASNSVARGKVIFERAACIGCHGKNGAGGQKNNNVAGGEINTLTFVADGFTKEELKDRIRKGSIPIPADVNAPAPMIRMPAWGEVLKDEEIDAVADYLISLRPALSKEEEW